MMNPMLPSRKQFFQDPGGYSRSAWMRWAMIASVNGAELDASKQPTSEDLKNPLLWLTQAEAMSQAAFVLLQTEPSFGNVPAEMRGICDSQYCAVALMLVGYSLEVCLKAMIIVKDGVETYSEAEKKYLTHNLKKLATFVGDLDAKDLATLERTIPRSRKQGHWQTRPRLRTRRTESNFGTRPFQARRKGDGPRTEPYGATG
jgi:hypothetical protein